MFDLLKKKISGFAEKLKKKVAEKEPETKEKPISTKPLPKKAQEPKTVEPEMPAPVKPKTPTPPDPETSAPPEPETLNQPEPKRELKARVSTVGKVKGLFSGEITIGENDVKDLMWELELSLLEADVEQATAEEICKSIKHKLVGRKVKRGEGVDTALKKDIRETLAEIMEPKKKINLLKEIKAKGNKPFKILMIGPNGAGKTTTMAKITHLLQSKGVSVLWSASDTFRAASIEQLEKHAENLKVRVVKHDYGADPAAVAFDAIKAAQAKGIDVVMIDSAGRQETDKNLMQELSKIVRVAQPDLKIYVGEAFTGQALLQQASEYNKIVGIDAFALTKIDCDAKGGTVISLIHKLGKPVLFVGTGQEYDDLQEFEPEFVLQRVIG